MSPDSTQLPHKNEFASLFTGIGPIRQDRLSFAVHLKFPSFPRQKLGESGSPAGRSGIIAPDSQIPGESGFHSLQPVKILATCCGLPVTFWSFMPCSCRCLSLKEMGEGARAVFEPRLVVPRRCHNHWAILPQIVKSRRRICVYTTMGTSCG